MNAKSSKRVLTIAAAMAVTLPVAVSATADVTNPPGDNSKYVYRFDSSSTGLEPSGFAKRQQPERSETLSALQLGLNQAVRVARNEGMNVYYYGSRSFEKQMQRASAMLTPLYSQNLQLQNKGGRNKPDILIVESGSIIQEAFFTEQASRGNVVISVGGSAYDPAKVAIAKMGGESGAYKRAAGRLDNGPVVYEKATGYYRSSTGGRYFATLTQNPEKAAAEAVMWATDVLGLQTEGLVQVKVTGSFVNQRTYTYSTGDLCNPKGKQNLTLYYDKLSNETNGSYDWWTAKYVIQSVPGIVAYSGSNWRTADVYNWARYNYVNTSFKLLDYDPSTTSGTGTAAISLAVGASSSGLSGTATKQWSYAITDMPVSDRGDLGTNYAEWWHNVNEAALVGTSTTKVEPGSLVRVPNGTTGVPSKFAETFISQFRNGTGGSFSQCAQWFLYPDKDTH
jgi:hypothetical protein